MWALIVRNPLRHRWRSALTVAGIATGVALLLFTNAFLAGWMDAMVRGATAVELGQVQIHDPRWVERSSLFATLELDASRLDAFGADPAVTGVAPRVIASGLVGNEVRSSVARLVGIDPERERHVTTLHEGLDTGEWLATRVAEPGPRPVLVGAQLARQLGVGVGDELVVFAQAADGSLGNDLLRVAATLRTGNLAVDRHGVYFHIDDLRWLVALEGRAHEVALATRTPDDAEAVADRLQAIVGDGPDAPVVRDWKRIQPEMSAMVETSAVSSLVMYFFVYLLVAMGVVNTARMAALERRREFGVLLGLGVTPARLGFSIAAETTLLTLVGGLAGTVLGYAGVLWFHIRGLSMTGVEGGEGLSMMGVSFGDRLYFPLEAASAVGPLVVLLGVGVLCGLWPAIWAARLHPVSAIAGRDS